LLLHYATGARYLLADKGYDANAIRKTLRQNGKVPVIPGRINRKRKIAYDKRRYKDRHPRTSGAWQPGMTSSLATSYQPSHLQSSSHSGYD